MGRDTRIEWAKDTCNPWIGCSRVSEGCERCYAHDWARRWNRAGFGDEPREVRVDRALAELRALDRKASKSGRKRNVFVCSLSDFFEDRPELGSRGRGSCTGRGIWRG